jgi:hypothetical protein
VLHVRHAHREQHEGVVEVLVVVDVEERRRRPRREGRHVLDVQVPLGAVARVVASVDDVAADGREVLVDRQIEEAVEGPQVPGRVLLADGLEEGLGRPRRRARSVHVLRVDAVEPLELLRRDPPVVASDVGSVEDLHVPLRAAEEHGQLRDAVDGVDGRVDRRGQRVVAVAAVDGPVARERLRPQEHRALEHALDGVHGRPDGDEAAAARRVGLEAQPREPGLDGGRVRRVRRQGPDLVRGPELAEPRVARRARGEHGGLELVEVRVAQLEGHGVDLAAVDARGLAPVGQRAVAAGRARRLVEIALRLGPPQARHAAALARGQQRRRQRRREHARREVPDGQAPAVAGEPRDDAEGCCCA